MLRPIRKIHNSNGTVWTAKEGLYYADSENGHIWSEKRHKWLSEGTLPKGYKNVSLYVDEQEEKKSFRVHRLIWESFNGEIPQGLEVNHISEDKSDNRLANLNLLTHPQNMNFGTGVERMAKAKSKEVLQYDLNGELVAIWPSTQECGRNGFDHGAVSSCCRGVYKQYKGFIWCYKEDS